MGGFLARRALNYAVLLLLASFLTFSLASLTFRPLDRFEEANPRPPQSVIDAKADELRLNDPIPQRYVEWLGDAVTGDFGKTLGGQPVSDELGRRIGISLQLLILGSIIGAVVGVVVGAAGAIRQYKFSDYFTTAVSLLLLSTPVFLLATLLKFGAIEVNAATGEQIFEFTGQTSATAVEGMRAELVDRAQHLVLPTIALSLGGIAAYSRYQRNAMLDVLGSDFIRTARAKGLTRRKALFKHGLRTALIPMATFFAYGFGGLVTGAVFIENIFGWHGVGEWIKLGIDSQDTNIVAAVTSFTGLIVLLSGMLSDIVYAALDPRVRVG
ncbi:ABC transporter permease [Antrihabitans sp. YC3-6]|uniref:ABC transporter permease n=1 Tax=Antrihabitans stalagmiti TaxID=2799499 RepID=A0A934U3W5_9NOCA|nr:ABC transporter permease [Antrihabitans stalagmiti]MBJ8339901.1 ABC transporter permease [Antrihabitans stalagmiti]